MCMVESMLERACNNEIDVSFKDIKQMVSIDNFLNYPDWNNMFKLQSDDSGK